MDLSASWLLPNHIRRLSLIPSLLRVLPIVLLAFAYLLRQTPAGATGKLVRVHLFISGREVITTVPVVADDTEVYAPLEVLKAVGANAQISPRGDTVMVTEKSTGRNLELGLARMNGAQMIALSDLGHVVDGVAVRLPARKGDSPSSSAVNFCARVSNIRMDGNRVQIETSFPVQYRVEAPKPVTELTSYVECDGAVLDGYRPAQQLVGVKLFQVTPNIVRIEIALPSGLMVQPTDPLSLPVRAFSAAFVARPVTTPMQSRSISAPSGLLAGGRQSASSQDEPDPIAQHVTRVAWPPVRSQSPSGATVNVPESSHVSAGPVPSRNAQPPTRVEDDGHARASIAEHSGAQNVTSADGQVAHPGQSKPAEIRSLSFQTDNTSRARVELQINGKANAVVHYLPGTTQMEIDIANAVISLPDQDTGERTVQHPLVDHISIAEAPGSPGNVRVQIDTSRIVGYTLTIQQDRLSLDLRMPRNASGALSDKLIVVDAGHGGTATGASGHGPEGTVYEKTITLAIAMRLRALLEQCGARVVVTRDSDVDVPLYDRPKLANTIGADLFISIHNDSTPRLNSASGTTTYYHSTDPSSRALAVCVQDAVRSVTGLPSKGALSDTVLYASGLAVLRNSTMPAVLCEVAYINNNGDRSKLINAAFQDRVARAMCDGLKNYVEGRPRSSSRQIQPEVTPSDAQALQGDDPTH